MNELPLSVFEVLLGADLVTIAYSLYGIDFEKVKIDRIIATIIAAPLSFTLANYIINGNVVQTYVDSSGYHYISVQSQPLNLFLLGIGVFISVLSILLIVKIIHDHFQKLEQKSALGDWK